MYSDQTFFVIGGLICVPIMSLILAISLRLAMKWAGRLKIGYGAAYLTTVLIGLGLLTTGFVLSSILPEGTAEKFRLGGSVIAALVVCLRHRIGFFRGLAVTGLWVVINLLSGAAVALLILLIGVARSAAKPASSAHRSDAPVQVAQAPIQIVAPPNESSNH